MFSNLVEFAGFKIPKDTVILANLRDAHYDKGYWVDPHNFRPERFIDDANQKIVKHEAFMPFSTGKRTCLGDSMAKDSLFIFFTSLLQKFRVEKDPDFGPLSLEPNAPTLIVAPCPFNIIIKNRTWCIVILHNVSIYLFLEIYWLFFLYKSNNGEKVYHFVFVYVDRCIIMA